MGEARQMDIARRARQDIAKEETELVQLEEEYIKALEEEKAHREELKDKEMARYDSLRNIVTNIDNQTYTLTEKAKDLQKQMQSIEAQIQWDDQESQRVENALKQERSMLQHATVFTQNQRDAILAELRNTAKVHRESYYATLDRRDIATGSMRDHSEP